MADKKVMFEIVSEIKTKARPRATIIKGHARIYDPTNPIYENLVKMCYQRECRNVYFEKNEPVRATIQAYFKVPDNKKKYLQAEIPIACVVHKDLDNIAKIVLDSLNGIELESLANIKTIGQGYFGNNFDGLIANEEWLISKEELLSSGMNVYGTMLSRGNPLNSFVLIPDIFRRPLYT